MRSKTASIALAGFALVTASSFQMPTYVVWNVSESMPRGLYWIDHRPALRGDIAVVRLPEAIAEFAARRDYLPKAAVLIKQVAAMGGDRVCRFGTNVFTNAHRRASAQIHDYAGRLMPIWSGCQLLKSHEVFLLGLRPGSFDSRYFGSINASRIVGRATILWSTD